MKLSTHMREALGHIAAIQASGHNPHVAVHQPKSKDDLGIDDPMYYLGARTLFALWQRGLVRFDVHASLTDDGRKAVQEDARNTPGQRNFVVISNDEGDAG